MKQRSLLSILFVCAFFVTTRAQIGKGSIWVGGSVGYNEIKSDNVSSDDQNNHAFSIKPALGRAVKENLIVGILLNYSKNTQKISGSGINYDKTIGKEIGGGIFIRQYVPIPVVKQLYVFGEATAAFNTQKIIESSLYNTIKSEYTSKGWNTSVSFTPGMAYSITRKLQLESGFNSLLSVNYAKSRRNVGQPNKETGESFSAGMNLDGKSSFFIGFRLLINSKG